MWGFLTAALLLIGMVLVMLIPALLRPQSTLNRDDNAQRREIFRAQFAEIEQDLASGVLDAAQYELAKTELERRMLDEVTSSPLAATVAKPDRRLAVILVFLVPLTAFWLYVKIGNPEAIVNPTGAAMMDGKPMTQADVEGLLASLAAKLEKNPDDGAGWVLLGNSYVKIGKYAEAVKAYEQATKKITDNAQLYADYADALAATNDYKLEGLPVELANLALKIDARNIKAKMLLATAAYDRQDYKEAIALWEKIITELPKEAEIIPDIKAAIAKAQSLAGETKSTSVQKVAVNAGIRGTVRLSPALTKALDANATLFVFARAAQGAPMPIAIVRASAKDLPYQFQLDDTSAIMPSNKLSQADAVVVVARISKSGDAKPISGDLQGMSAVMKPVGENVEIEINEVLK
ncbi:MAG: c-type cytochrome biogenesis protein CcmI [Methylotenera sp.]|jgi:cytochrome c-type biogenesis protein CcmH|nr:c-type cytochrome biogenesis protein CcmI [Methylotenera sp.]HPH07444.1 c-type cytochrome biogenesis protein CcmI [Methylotenera sp.]HPM49740.1 c-type cytochrome biogenesis protein CcmI [Methylotenera sp.]